MGRNIRHPRLYAFYQSKVLNTLMIVFINALLLMDWFIQAGYYWMVPLICSAVAFVLFAGYALWLWVCKPGTIVINRWLSEMSGYLTLYCLAVVVMRAGNQWWYILPAVCSIVMFVVLTVKPKDERFTIVGRN